MASGDTKTEAMLNVLGNGGSGDEFRGCCNTKTQQYILDAIDRVQNVEDEVERLENNPDVVDIVATYQDLQDYDTSGLTDKDIIRVLQDETHDGNSTYYRWNAATNQFDFVGEIAGGTGGAVKTLTTADYNWPTTGTKTSVALWLLDDGVYVAPGTVLTRLSTTVNNGGSGWVVVKGTAASDRTSYLVYNGSAQPFDYYANPTNGSGATGGERFFIESNRLEQSTGTSTTSVMSQNATTSMVFADPGTDTKIKIGSNASSSIGNYGVEIGYGSTANAYGAIAIGRNSTVESSARGIAIGDSADAKTGGNVALGAYSTTPTTAGYVSIDTSQTTFGYNGTNYRILTGVHDPVDTHDAATKGYVDTRIILNAGAPTTATVGTVGQLLEDTTNGKLYQCTAVSGNTYTWTEVGTGGVTPVQTTGTSTTSVMSQNAVTSMVFADAGTNKQIQIGDQSSAPGNVSVAIGYKTDARSNSIAIGNQAKGGTSNTHLDGIAIGVTAKTSANGAISLGAYSQATQQGEMNIGTTQTSDGYNNSNYRLISGVHDPVNAHDAATKGYVDGLVGNVASALNAINNGTGA